MTAPIASDPALKGSCRFFGLANQTPPYALARLPCVPSLDWSRANANRLRGASSSHAPADGGAGRPVSCHSEHFPNRRTRQTADGIAPPVRQNEFDGGRETLLGRNGSTPLPICTRHLGAVGDEPLSVFLDDGGKFVSHGGKMRLPPANASAPSPPARSWPSTTAKNFSAAACSCKSRLENSKKC